MHGEGKGDRVIEGKDPEIRVLNFYDWAITRSLNIML